MEGAGDHPDGAGGVPLRRSEFLPRSHRSRPGRHGRSAGWCSASICRAAPICCSRSIPTTSRRTSSTRSATTCAARCARPRSATPALPRAPTASRSASRIPTCRPRSPRLRELSQPLGGLLGSSGQRSLEVTDAGGGLIRLTRAAGRDHRAHPPDHRAVDPDRRAPRQRARHRRAADPAPGHRSHPGAGAGPAGSDPAEGTARQDRQDGIPHGRYDRAAGSGASGQGAAGFRSADEFDRAENSLCRQEAGAGLRRRFDRRAAGLRPALRRADRQLPLQHRPARANSRRRRRRMSGSPLRSCSTTR